MVTPEFKKFPEHPITRGVKPFSNRDEWYFNIRFREDMNGITPILVATPSDKVRDGPYVYPGGPYEHIQKNKGRPETMMWAYERPDGGRGFGFTGGHTHPKWGYEKKRQIVLNPPPLIAKTPKPPARGPTPPPPPQPQQKLDP